MFRFLTFPALKTGQAFSQKPALNSIKICSSFINLQYALSVTIKPQCSWSRGFPFCFWSANYKCLLFRIYNESWPRIFLGKKMYIYENMPTF